VVNAAVSRRDDTIDIIGNSSLASHDDRQDLPRFAETWLANPR
jgi:hypothetical protein